MATGMPRRVIVILVPVATLSRQSGDTRDSPFSIGGDYLNFLMPVLSIALVNSSRCPAAIIGISIVGETASFRPSVPSRFAEIPGYGSRGSIKAEPGGGFVYPRPPFPDVEYGWSRSL